MTTHEFDAYLDMQHGDYFEPPYHEDSLLAEQERDFHEMESERTVALRREGAQEALTQLREVFRNHNSYARRYSLWMAFGLATADDDGVALNPVKPTKRGAKPDGKATGKSSRTAGLDRSAEVNRISLLVNSGRLSLEEVQATVRKYGTAKMNDLSDDAFTECVAVLTKPRQSSYEAPYCHQGS